MENHVFLMGKSTINRPFSIAMLNYQRVSLLVMFWSYQQLFGLVGMVAP
jgi:hypothetical protein